MWYHSSNTIESELKINRNNFNNRYGQGIYFTDSKEYSKKVW